MANKHFHKLCIGVSLIANHHNHEQQQQQQQKCRFTSKTTRRLEPTWSSYNKQLSCCCDSLSYCVRRTVYWQTIKPFSVTSFYLHLFLYCILKFHPAIQPHVWNKLSVQCSSLPTAGSHDPIERVEFMNAPKLSTQAW